MLYGVGPQHFIFDEGRWRAILTEVRQIRPPAGFGLSSSWDGAHEHRELKLAICATEESFMLKWMMRIAAPVVAVAILGAASAARADTIAVSFVSQVGNTFTYSANLSANGIVNAGDGFTIFDIALPTGASISMAGWNYVVTSGIGSPIATVAAHGALLSPGGDSAAIDNVSFIWNGPSLSGSQSLGTFAVTTDAPWVGSDIAISKDSGSDTPFAFGPVGVASMVPLPAAAWGGMALFGVLGGAKLRRSRQSVLA